MQKSGLLQILHRHIPVSYTHLPEACPVCKAPADKFVKQDGEMSWAAEHVVGLSLIHI